METKSVQITCPQCGHQFSPEAAMEGHLRAHLEKEYSEKSAVLLKNAELRAKEQAQQEYAAKIKFLETDAAEKSRKVRELEIQSLALRQKEKELLKKSEEANLEITRKVLEAEERIRKEAEKIAFEKAELSIREIQTDLIRKRDSMETQIRKEALQLAEKVREEESLKYAELLKVHEEQKRLLDLAKRKAEQGSMQLQGEVQEVAIEEFLTNAFHGDLIEEISKGVKGGDCVHIVRDNFGNECGRILYESKRTKSFSKEWIAKIKDDVRRKQAGLAVIVTEAMPAELTRFGQIDGIWICSFAEFKSVSTLLRYAMIRIGEVMAAQENKDDKMQMLYEYLTGSEFRQRIESISEAFTQMNADLQKEKAQSEANFGKREKQLQKVLLNTMALYGEVRGIAGSAVQVIRALEQDTDSAKLREAV